MECIRATFKKKYVRGFLTILVAVFFGCIWMYSSVYNAKPEVRMNKPVSIQNFKDTDTSLYTTKPELRNKKPVNVRSTSDRDMTVYTGQLQVLINTPIDIRSTNDTEPYDVIVVAYMRSGSSYIGRLFGKRDDTFFWYEPLWATHKWQFHSKGQLVCNYTKDICRNVTGSPFSVQSSLKFLLDIYKCKLTGHFLRVDDFISTLSTIGDFRKCLYSEHGCEKCGPNDCTDCKRNKKSCIKCPQTAFRQCYDKWTKNCNLKAHRATKVLRLDTSHAKYLLENHKRLKLIQVFRDPRAVISSRYSRWSKTYPVESDAKVLCERMESDITSAEQLKNLFPNRVKIIQYEDFSDANRTARILYDFLNMKITNNVKHTILAPLYDPNIKTITGFHPDSYRYKFDPKFILFTNKYCQTVFKRLGLRQFNSATEIQNKSLNVILDKVSYPLE